MKLKTISNALINFPALVLNLLKDLSARKQSIDKLPTSPRLCRATQDDEVRRSFMRRRSAGKISIKHSKTTLLLSCLMLIVPHLYSMSVIPTTSTEQEVVIEQDETLYPFSYENEDLVTIINSFATKKELNIILPQAEPINTKVSLHIDRKLTLAECWDLIITLLDVAGFTIVPHENATHIIKNPGKDISREPMPTYIGVNIEDLPPTDQYIRYLYYLANIKVSDAPENELNGLLKDLLPENALFKADSNTNGLLIVAKSTDIQAVMKIIIELDTVGFQEKVDILPLRHTSAGIVSQLLNEHILKSETANAFRLDTKKAKDAPYFSNFTKVIPDERLNNLIILGRSQAVDRLKTFVKQYIDVEPDSGESTLHVYRLQYLEAQEFAQVLTNIVAGSTGGGPSQARGGEKATGGTERFFDDVIVFADKTTSEALKYKGGNKLVVAARNDDWKQIKKIIEDLDQPQLQVLLEVLIADLTVDDIKALSSMLRVPAKIPFPDTMSFQSAQAGLKPIPNQLPNPTSLNADLLQYAYVPTAVSGASIPVLNLGTTISQGDLAATAVLSAADQTIPNNPALPTPGTTFLSLNDNDGRTWSILEILQTFTHSKIISHPHVMATNNKQAKVVVGEQRFLTDAASGSLGGTTVINQKPINANLEVKVTPRISTDNVVNLEVNININEFIAAASSGNNTINQRVLKTNANIRSGGIFALGGLIKNTTINLTSETPFLGKVPILGWFFKQRKNEVVQNNLTVFICPTIIKPRLRGGVNEYTEEYITLAKHYASDELFTNLKDPITHWFFKPHQDSDSVIDTYIDRTQESAEHPGAIIDLKNPLKKVAPATREVVAHNNNDNESDALADLKEKLKDENNPFILI